MLITALLVLIVVLLIGGRALAGNLLLLGTFVVSILVSSLAFLYIGSKAPLFLISYLAVICIIFGLAILISTKREQTRKTTRDEEGHQIWLKANRPSKDEGTT